MRIAIISYHTCPLATLGGKDTGGMNVYIKELTKQLGKLNIHVDVYTRSQDEHVPHIIHDLGYGNRVVHIPAGPEIPLQKKQLTSYISDFSKNVIDFAFQKNLSYNLIHSHYWMSGLAAKYIKETWDLPIVHMFHTLGLMKNRIALNGEEQINQYEGDYRINGEREVLAIADKIIAATQAELAQLQWLYEVPTDHVEIIPPGVAMEHFYPIPKDEARAYTDFSCNKFMILFVGRIEPLKGIDTLIRSVSLIKENLSSNDEMDICLGIIGGDASVSEDEMSKEMFRLQQLRDELNLDAEITFLGKRSQDILPYYYSSADIVVVPSHYESFGMVALEAMACGTPVIASQVGGLAYLIQDGVTGYHIPNQDPEALSKRLLSISRDKILLEKMGKQAAEYANEYSWENITNQIVNLYNEVIK